MRLAELEELRPGPSTDKSWVFKGDKYKYTSSRAIIDQELEELRRRRTIVEFLAPGYKSSPSMIISFGPDGLELDRPVDWPGLTGRLFIQFRFPGYPYSYLIAGFLQESGSSIFLSYPELLVVNERRQFFRIPVPSGCLLVVPKKNSGKGTRRKKKGKVPVRYAGSIKDVSLGGVCFCLEPRRFATPPPLRARIGPLRLVLKVNNQKIWDEIEISEGEVVRSRETSADNGRWFEVALKFILKGTEEKKLYEYVRLREIELAKVSD